MAVGSDTQMIQHVLSPHFIGAAVGENARIDPHLRINTIEKKTYLGENFYKMKKRALHYITLSV